MHTLRMISLTALLALFLFSFSANNGLNLSNLELNSHKNNSEEKGKSAVAEGGSLVGTITYQGAIPKKLELKVSKDALICGKKHHYDESLLVGKNKGLQNVVVSIKNVTGGKNVNSLGTTFELHQTDCSFKPHVCIVPVRVPLTIFNNDGILHNLHTMSKKNRSFNVAQPKFKKKLQKKFKKPEIVKIKCDVHRWMSGYIVVVDNPYNAISDAGGEYVIDDIPAGTYQVDIWHEKLGTMQKEVQIKAGAKTSLNLSFSAKGK